MGFVYAIAGLLILLLLLFALTVFMVAPNRRRDVSRFCGGEFAHRGLFSPDPDDSRAENSPAAFREAAHRRCGVELDIQLTADRQVVVFHDGNIKRMCGADFRVSELTYEQLCGYPLPNGERIPLFSDVLELLDGVPVICEVKTGKSVSDVECCDLAADMICSYKGDICVESFSPFIVRWFRKNRPELIRGQLSSAFRPGEEGLKPLSAFALGNLLINFLGRPDFIAYDFARDSLGFQLCRRLFSPFCIGWTARGDGQRRKARERFGTVIFEEKERTEGRS